MEGVPYLRVSRCYAQDFRKYLQSQDVLDTSLSFLKDIDETIILPILTKRVSRLDIKHLQSTVASDSICEIIWSEAFKKKKKQQAVVNKLEVALQRLLLESIGEDWTEGLKRDLPRSFERHGDLILLGHNCFSQFIWKQIGDSLWTTVAKVLGANRLAKISHICSNGFRSPVVTMLHGEHSWVTHVDNGIRYDFDVTKCMFSSGNITEKLRVATFDCKGETVVDLYAGIGYFTLPYLVHSGAAHVHACEWNPDAIEALHKNLQINKVSEHCTIHQGDNRQLQLYDIADRVNLGLIPSSEDGWPVACRLLKRSTGGILHIHYNVTSPVSNRDSSLENIPAHKNNRETWQVWAHDTAKCFTALLKDTTGTEWRTHVQHIEHVKSYAPHVHHVVLDLECRPLVGDNEHNNVSVALM
uniref:tRNA wybutosine-synthesizing protein 2 homolog n=1 Tax=Neogobius melanostomus TaxID=47308 RepID=A0A8C6TF08_9GOBI